MQIAHLTAVKIGITAAIILVIIGILFASLYYILYVDPKRITRSIREPTPPPRNTPSG